MKHIRIADLDIELKEIQFKSHIKQSRAADGLLSAELLICVYCDDESASADIEIYSGYVKCISN